MRKTPLTDEALCAAVAEMAAGLVDADFGGYVLKKRVALPGRGKRGGVRTLVATRKSDLWFSVFGFEKSERDNITAEDLAALRDLGEHLLRLAPPEIDIALTDGTLEEICHAHETKPDPGSGR